MFPAFKATNHPHQVMKRGVDDSTDDRETPPDVWNPLNDEFHFTLDVAAARHNAKCRCYYAKAGYTADEARQGQLFPTSLMGDPEALGYDGLAQTWGPEEVIWCNPPFSDLEPWMAKAHGDAATWVMLLPANRTEQPAWQRYVEPYRDRNDELPEWREIIETRWEGDRPLGTVRTRNLAGRRSFLYQGEVIGNSTSKAPPFGICIVIWDRRGQPWWCLQAAEQRWMCIIAPTRAEAGERFRARTGKIAAYVLTNEELKVDWRRVPNYAPIAKPKRAQRKHASSVQHSEAEKEGAGDE